jgi:hypothetical protein
MIKICTKCGEHFTDMKLFSAHPCEQKKEDVNEYKIEDLVKRIEALEQKNSTRNVRRK